MKTRFIGNRHLIHVEIILGVFSMAIGLAGWINGTALNDFLWRVDLLNQAGALIVGGAFMATSAATDQLTPHATDVQLKWLANLRAHSCLLTGVFWLALGVLIARNDAIETLMSVSVMAAATIPYAAVCFYSNLGVAQVLSPRVATPALALDRRRH